jgi:hypothetical protein
MAMPLNSFGSDPVEANSQIESLKPRRRLVVSGGPHPDLAPGMDRIANVRRLWPRARRFPHHGIELRHDPQRRRNRREYDDDAESKGKNIAGIVWIRCDVKKEDEMHAHPRGGGRRQSGGNAREWATPTPERATGRRLWLIAYIVAISLALAVLRSVWVWTTLPMVARGAPRDLAIPHGEQFGSTPRTMVQSLTATDRLACLGGGRSSHPYALEAVPLSISEKPNA